MIIIIHSDDGDVGGGWGEILLVTVIPTNDPPLSISFNVSLRENEYVLIKLWGIDIDGDSLTFIIQTLPSLGTLYQVCNKTSTLDAFIYSIQCGRINSFCCFAFDCTQPERYGMMELPVINS
jgi:hypothetical protein